MGLFLDIMVLVVIAFFVITGYKKGFFYAILNVGGTLVASAASAFIASLVSIPIYNALFKDRIISLVSEAMKDIPEKATNLQQATMIVNEIPDYIKNVLSFSGISDSMLAEDIAKNIAIPELIESYVRAYAVRMVSTVLTVLLFLILSILLKVFAATMTKTSETLKLGMVNKIFGAVFGATEALFIVMVLSLLMYFFMMFATPDLCQSINTDINDSQLYKLIYQFSMPDKIISLFSLK